MMPTWLVIIFVVALVLYVLKGMFFGTPISELSKVLKGKGSGIGCLIKSILSIVAGTILIWYIITESF